MLPDEYRSKVLRILEEDPAISQRGLACQLCISLGKANHCLQALFEKGWIKANNFKNSNNKNVYMGKYVAREILKLTARSGRPVKGATVNVLGLTLKEDCPDLRNSKVVDIIRELREHGCEIFAHDPVADPGDAEREYGIKLLAWEELPIAHALTISVTHREFAQRPPSDHLQKITPDRSIVEIKSIFDRRHFRQAGVNVWRL